MQAITFQDLETVSVEEMPSPRIEEPLDVVLEVRLAGICGSDLHVYHGRERGLDPGTIMGHEFVGEVVEVGSGVRSLRLGDLVTGSFTTSCGDCLFCRRGLTSRCSKGQLFGWREQGVGLHGAQAERLRVPLADGTLVAIPSHCSHEQALLAGDVLATGYYCARMGAVRADTSVAVIGCGPVGLMASLVAVHLGAEPVFAVDSVVERLALAARCGAEPIDLSQRPPSEVVGAATGGRGVDVALEAVGSPAAARLAFELVRPGGTISAVGVHTEPVFAFTPTEAYDKNLTFRIGRCPARRLLGDVLDLLAELPIDPAIVISHRLPLSRGVDGYRLFADKLDGCTKVVLRP